MPSIKDNAPTIIIRFFLFLSKKTRIIAIVYFRSKSKNKK